MSLIGKSYHPRSRFSFHPGYSVRSAPEHCSQTHRVETVSGGQESILSTGFVLMYATEIAFPEEAALPGEKQLNCEKLDFILTLSTFNSVPKPYGNNTALHLSFASHDLLDEIVPDSALVSTHMGQVTDSTIGRSLSGRLLFSCTHICKSLWQVPPTP